MFHFRLYKLPSDGCQVQNLAAWLYDNKNFPYEQCIASYTKPFDNIQKNVNSRTFTRPKKRSIRPSVEKYNETIYGIGNEEINSLRENIPPSSDVTNSVVSESLKPLNFDLSQPSNSLYFENIAANMRDSDSFQNISPPSLVNSTCSSTFANLMESSFIKNDPVLREIRDKDFTESILLQDLEAPMFQSITESCSSVTSDTPESFLKKVSKSDSLKIKSICDLERTVNYGISNQANETFDIDYNITPGKLMFEYEI